MLPDEAIADVPLEVTAKEVQQQPEAKPGAGCRPTWHFFERS
jgi:hypothetical protein